MTPFKDRTWNQRVSEMGDAAENVCDIMYGGYTHQLGLNRVWQNGVGLYMRDMTDSMRYTPDRMTKLGFVECMGIGRDRKLKIKAEKIDALYNWVMIGPTSIGVYDQTAGHWYEAPLAFWATACYGNGVQKRFPDNNKVYYELHVDNFPTDPQEIPWPDHANPE